jgi:hypothetical protein
LTIWTSFALFGDCFAAEIIHLLVVDWLYLVSKGKQSRNSGADPLPKVPQREALEPADLISGKGRPDKSTVQDSVS